jgi:RNA polymerase sigma-70 factor (sigma-E family)
VTFEQYATDRLPTMLGTARAICGDPSLAEDLVQDVLIKVHAHWDSISSMDAPDAYVRRMIVNGFISWRRKWGRLSPRADSSMPTELERGDHATEYAERDALVAEVRRLPPRQRMVIALRYFADVSDRDIADALDCTETTVRVHASRALATLRIQVQPTLTRRDG